MRNILVICYQGIAAEQNNQVALQKRRLARYNPLKTPSKRQTDRQTEQRDRTGKEREREREREKALLKYIKCCIIGNIKYSCFMCMHVFGHASAHALDIPNNATFNVFQ